MYATVVIVTVATVGNIARGFSIGLGGTVGVTIAIAIGILVVGFWCRRLGRIDGFGVGLPSVAVARWYGKGYLYASALGSGGWRIGRRAVAGHMVAAHAHATTGVNASCGVETYCLKGRFGFGRLCCINVFGMGLPSVAVA